MNWDEKKIEILKENWGKLTASAIAEKIGDISRNAVIGKAYRLNLSSKIKGRNISNSSDAKKTNNEFQFPAKKIRRNKFKSLLIEKDFEPENPKHLEELNESTCKWPIGHPNESSFYFCGRSSLKDFSYCKLHLLYAFQPKGKKEDDLGKNNEMSQYQYVEKKNKSA